VSGRLVICGTPIGNLADASPRLRDELATADLIYAEDTRRAATLLRALEVTGQVRSYFVGNEERRSAELTAHLAAGDTVALITDAGMPAVSDPGLSAVRAAIACDAAVSVVPGPSAVTAAVAISGFAADRFVFEGFLPRKGRSRRSRIAAVAAEERTVVLFSAKTRLAADLADLRDAAGTDRPVVVARELTKLYEEVWRGTLAGATVEFGDAARARGEFTIVIAGAPEAAGDVEEAVAAAIAAIDAGESPSAAVRRLAGEKRIGRRDLYEAVLRERERSS
jgi:16S rRNA (cytidine1402-2'-O)-methyltransferase